MNEIDLIAGQIASRQHGAFATSQIAGITPRQILTRTSSRRWRQVSRTVYIIEGAPDTWKHRIWVALLIGGTGCVVGERTALKLQNIRGISGEPIDILQPELTVPNAKANTSRRSTRILSWHKTSIEGFPVTTIERSLFDVAGLTSPIRRRNGWTYVNKKTVARWLDNALLQELTTVQSMMRLHASLAGRGRPGSRLMRSLLEERCGDFVPTDSELEDMFVRLIADHGLPQPQRQVWLGSSDAQIGRVDFYYDQARFIVEADGRAFHGQRDQILHDHQRDLEFLAQGWQVLHVDWWQLSTDGARVARLLREILARRATAG